MEVILLEHIEKLGRMGEKVTVKNGYARNYLLPQNKALRATEANLAVYEKQKADLEAHNKKLFDTASQLAESLKGYSAVLIRQAAETGQLYGSVTIRDIAAAIKESGFVVERRQVFLGLMIAVPLAAIIGVLARFAITKYKQSSLYK